MAEQLSLFVDEESKIKDDFQISLNDKVDIKHGDIFLLGEHRLMCGDSTIIEDVDKLMDGNKADMVFTDPPYGVNYKSNMSNRFNVIMNDNVILDIINPIKKYSKNDIHWYIWTSHNVYEIWKKMFLNYYKNTIIWYKGGGGMGDLEGDYATDYEMCIFCHFGRKLLNNQRTGAVWKISKDNSVDYVHPTQKPIELAIRAINNSSKTNDIILDLFGGSGSTLIASELTDRKCYMMELDPQYVDVIIRRYEYMFKKKAVKIS